MRRAHLYIVILLSILTVSFPESSFAKIDLEAKVKEWVNKKLNEPSGLGKTLNHTFRSRIAVSGVQIQVGFSYGVSVRYNSSLGTYELTETFGTAPGVSFGKVLAALGLPIGFELSVNRSHELVVTRGGFHDLHEALRAIPYHLRQFPTTAEEAMKMLPGSQVSLPVGSALAVNTGVGLSQGPLKESVSFGWRVLGKFNVIIERLLKPEEGDREFVIQILGGVEGSGGVNAKVAVDLPVLPSINLIDYERERDREKRVVYSSGPVSLNSSEAALIYHDLILGQFRLPDAHLLIETLSRKGVLADLVFARSIPEDSLQSLENVTRLMDIAERVKALPEVVRWHRGLVTVDRSRRTLPTIPLVGTLKTATSESRAGVLSFSQEKKSLGSAEASHERKYSFLGLKFFESESTQVQSVWNVDNRRMLHRVEWDVIDAHSHSEEVYRYLKRLLELIPPNERNHLETWNEYGPSEEVPSVPEGRCDSYAQVPEANHWLAAIHEGKWESSFHVQVTLPNEFIGKTQHPDLKEGSPGEWKFFEKEFLKAARAPDPWSEIEWQGLPKSEVSFHVELSPKDEHAFPPKRSFSGRLGPCLREADFLFDRWRDVADPEERP